MPIFSNFSSSSAQGYGELRNINKAWADNFQKTATVSGLGNSFDGQPWTATRGNWFINASGQAQTNDSNYSIASTYLGINNINNLIVSGISNGTGVTFWQVDANNWWAASLTAVLSGYQYTTGTTVTGCNYNIAPYGSGVYTGSSLTPNGCGTSTQTQTVQTSSTGGRGCCNPGCAPTPNPNNCQGQSCTSVTCQFPSQYCFPPCSFTSFVSCGVNYYDVPSYSSTCCCPTTNQPCPNYPQADPDNCGPQYGTQTVYTTNCYNSSGSLSQPSSTSGYPACPTGYSNAVCGPVCTPSSTGSTYTVTSSGSYYQFQILQSIGGVVSVVSGINLNTGTITVIASGNASLSAVLPNAIKITASGGITVANIYSDSSLTNSLASFVISGTGSLGESVGIINVPSGTIGSTRTINSFYSNI